MLGIAVGVAAVASVAYYLGHERLGAEGMALAALRATGLSALLVLVINPSWASTWDAPPTVLLDGSLSMAAVGGHFNEAVDSAQRIAGRSGRILRFGSEVRPDDGQPATDGASRVREALVAGSAFDGPLAVVTDGELTDAAAVPTELLEGVRVVLLPRDTTPGIALRGVTIPSLVRPEDSVLVALTMVTWGGLQTDRATVQIGDGDRRLMTFQTDLAPAPATVRRTVALAPGSLSPGLHVLDVSVSAEGDAEIRDNNRRRLVTVSDRPTIVVVADPAGWEARFLVRTLTEVAGTAVRGYARIGDREWVDMRTGDRIAPDPVRAAVRRSRLLIVCGSGAIAGDWRGPTWHWWEASEGGSVIRGDWYPAGPSEASALSAAMAGISWDDVPPLEAIVPGDLESERWVALAARLGRRGAARPVIVGRVKEGRRELVTAGIGLWRWSLRGGRAAEAYRTVVSAGVDWLLRSATAPGVPTVTADPVVQRGAPVRFVWRRSDPPDTLHLVITRRDADAREEAALPLDADGTGSMMLDPGVYQWSVGGLGDSGMLAVEEYSDEFVPQSVTLAWPATASRQGMRETMARSQWWWFALVALAFGGEWAWRRRRGLP